MFSSLTLVLSWAQLKDRLTATPLVHNNIREPVAQPSRRIRFRALSPSRTGVGASRSRIELRINACSIATVAAIGLTALSLALAGPAAATGPHGTDGTGNHTATGATQEPADGAEGSTPQSENTEDPTSDPPVGELPTGADPGPAAGHEKCKRPKGNRELPPWCTDPASGWMGSTTLRAHTEPVSPPGICDASRGCRRRGPGGAVGDERGRGAERDAGDVLRPRSPQRAGRRASTMRAGARCATATVAARSPWAGAGGPAAGAHPGWARGGAEHLRALCRRGPADLRW